MPQVMDADRMARALTRIAHEIVERNRGTSDLGLVGFARAACRLSPPPRATLKSITHEDVPTARSDITLYRDDLMRPRRSGPQPVVRRTGDPFSIDARRILLGRRRPLYRAGRSARPRRADRFRAGRGSNQLIVLVDRGHASCRSRRTTSARNLPTSRRQSVPGAPAGDRRRGRSAASREGAGDPVM
jgi:pyrimidine operon attenuation protein/uracil phosphoribosyltransferase